MQIRLGDTIARCPRCGASDFVHADPGNDLDEASDMVCASCETPALHGELILQIAAKAYHDVGERLRAGPPRKKKPARRR